MNGNDVEFIERVKERYRRSLCTYQTGEDVNRLIEIADRQGKRADDAELALERATSQAQAEVERLRYAIKRAYQAFRNLAVSGAIARLGDSYTIAMNEVMNLRKILEDSAVDGGK